MNTDRRERNRIIVALDSLDPLDVALEIAQHLQVATVQEFLGLFVEDTYLLNHAQSSQAREIMLSGLERPLERSNLERQMRAQSNRIREQFEAAASHLGLAHSFRITRGELLAELMLQASQAEALVLSLNKNSLRLNDMVSTFMERLSPEPLPLLLLAREGWFRGQCILVLVTHPEREKQTLQIAARFAKQSRSPLKIILTGDALAKREASMREIEQVLRAVDVRAAEFIPMTTLSGAAIVHAARSNHARLLIVPSSLHDSLDLVGETCKDLTSALMVIRS